MDEPPRPRPAVDPARSFDLVADAYDRGRPAYPEAAVAWLLEDRDRPRGATRVVELAAGTGKLTEQLLARGCDVTATDPSEAMLARLARRAPRAHRLAGTAEQPPLAKGTADLVVAAQAFHWFDTERTLPEVARVLRRGGRLAVVWNSRDERIPWVRRLGRTIGATGRSEDPAEAIDSSAMFEAVERRTFRFWQPMTRDGLRDLVRSRSNVAMMSDLERERVLREVDAIYDGFGRGHDGMLLPYVTTVCRTRVLPWALPPDDPQDDTRHDPRVASDDAGRGSGGSTLPPTDVAGDDLLIDFR